MSELHESDYGDMEMKVFTPDERSSPVSLFQSDHITSNNINNAAEKRNVSFSEPTDTQLLKYSNQKVSDSEMRSLRPDVPRSREGSPSPQLFEEDAVHRSKVPLTSQSSVLSPIFPVRVDKTSSTILSPHSASLSNPLAPSASSLTPPCGNRTHTPVTLNPGSRPSFLTIPGPIMRSLSTGITGSEIHSSRSRGNSDASENYDMILGVNGNFSMDVDESRKTNGDFRGNYNSPHWDNESTGDNSAKQSSTGKTNGDIRKNKPTSVIIRSLGFAAKESITPQQLGILMRMRELLRTGVEILKHGRGGNPKRRTLYCESDFTKLFWRKLLDKRYCFLLIFSLFWSNEIIPLTSSDFFPFCSSNDLFFLFFFSITKRFFFFSEVLISCQFSSFFSRLIIHSLLYFNIFL